VDRAKGWECDCTGSYKVLAVRSRNVLTGGIVQRADDAIMQRADGGSRKVLMVRLKHVLWCD